MNNKYLPLSQPDLSCSPSYPFFFPLPPSQPGHGFCHTSSAQSSFTVNASKDWNSLTCTSSLLSARKQTRKEESKPGRKASVVLFRLPKLAKKNKKQNDKKKKSNNKVQSK